MTNRRVTRQSKTTSDTPAVSKGDSPPQPIAIMIVTLLLATPLVYFVGQVPLSFKPNDLVYMVGASAAFGIKF